MARIGTKLIVTNNRGQGCSMGFNNRNLSRTTLKDGTLSSIITAILAKGQNLPKAGSSIIRAITGYLSSQFPVNFNLQYYLISKFALYERYMVTQT